MTEEHGSSSAADNRPVTIADVDTAVDELAQVTKRSFDRVEQRFDNLEERFDSLAWIPIRRIDLNRIAEIA